MCQASPLPLLPPAPPPPDSPPALSFLFTFDTGSDGFATSGTYRWTRTSGRTPSSYTGPSAGSGGSGWYYFTEATSKTTGTEFRLSRSSPCALSEVSFDYHMYGFSMGTLHLDLDGQSVWSLQGNQGNSDEGNNDEDNNDESNNDEGNNNEGYNNADNNNNESYNSEGNNNEGYNKM